MKLNHLSIPIFTSDDLIEEIYKGNLNLLSKVQIHYADDIDYLSYVELVQNNKLEDWPIPEPYFGDPRSVEEFDKSNQTKFYMPEEYKSLDIEKLLYSLCKSDIEKARVKEELVLYEKYNMLPLLQFLKFLVDSMREDKILWGVGRGSSVASYCLFLLGIHKIDSIKYELDIREFLR